MTGLVLQNFDTEADRQATMRVSQSLGIQERVTVTPERTTAPSEAVTHLLSQDEEWTGEQLRDYVVNQIEIKRGPFPRDEPYKELSIFNSFVKRWGNRSAAIARFAFETCGGIWVGAPVSITRFCKGSDAYFAAPIAERIF